MLRITCNSETRLIKLEGQLLEPWVGEVIAACACDEMLTQPGRLDLSSVTFVDHAGVTLLHDLIRQGFRIVASSPFVAAMLQLETR